jgi:hypothetical protein
MTSWDGLLELPNGADIPIKKLPEDLQDGSALLWGEAYVGLF